MKLWLCILLFFISFKGYSQEKVTLSGYLKEASTGEAVIGGKIYIPQLKQGAVSNQYGFYSLTVPPGKYIVEYRSSSGKDSVEIDLQQNTTFDFEVGKKTQELKEVVINAKKGENVESTKIGQIELDVEKIKTLPAFMGEVDIVKTIQLLPGVSSVSEGGQGFYVRGGGPDQNLVLLDEATVYNASHLFGMFSVFNSDAIKSANLIKGSMPANYGGRISSVLEINMKEGNYKKFKLTGGLGIISSRLTLEGPIVKDKGSFVIAARRTYIDLLMKAFIPKSSPFAGSGYYFYDLNFKANYKLSKKDRIFLSAYYGKDQFTFGNTNDAFNVQMPWGNAIASLRWNHVFNPKLFMNVSATFTDYRFSFISDQDEFNFRLNSGIRDFGGKVDFTWFQGVRHKFKFGMDYTYHILEPSSVSAKQDDITFDTGLAQKLFGHESGIYILDEFDATEKLKFNVGVRYSMYQHTGPFVRYIKNNVSNPDSTITYPRNKVIKFYHGLEPRISGRWLVGKNKSIKAGYSYNYQYIHLTSMSAVSLPTDIWFPTTDIARPQSGWQASIGYFQNFKNDTYEASVEIYYKGMNNVIEFKEGALPADNVNDNTDNLLVFGKGWSYGIEFFFKKALGNFTGWIGYTWAKTERQFPDLNEGKVFPAKYDRRHDLTLVATYKLNDRLTFGANFIFATGNTMTLPTAWYVQGQDLLFHYGQRNSARMAPYHRLDISVTLYDKPLRKKKNELGEKVWVKKKLRSNWNLSVYNVYNRSNPYFLYVDSDGSFLSGNFQIKTKQVTLFPIIPSITWNFEL